MKEYQDEAERCARGKLADELVVPLPAASISREILRAAIAQGKGEMDSCIVMTMLEQMANTIVQLKK